MKKYALKNSYFKFRKPEMPETIIEIAKYYKETGELPFEYNGDNWIYDAFCEKQKRSGVQNSQYLTPDGTADRMLHFAGKYFHHLHVLEPCCGTGQITKELLKSGYTVSVFDVDKELVELFNLLYFDITATQCDFRDFKGRYNQIVSNPPYEVKDLTDFLEWILTIQPSGGTSVLLLPKGFVRKERPKKLREVLNQFYLIDAEDMREPFARTDVMSEIVVLRKS
jgi:SAM-dependent methyltransferase